MTTPDNIHQHLTKVLKFNNFVNWLETNPNNYESFDVPNGMSCPVAHYLRDTFYNGDIQPPPTGNHAYDSSIFVSDTYINIHTTQYFIFVDYSDYTHNPANQWVPIFINRVDTTALSLSETTNISMRSVLRLAQALQKEQLSDKGWILSIRDLSYDEEPPQYFYNSVREIPQFSYKRAND